jgi:OOP family OmpA-OmpF porin
VKQTDPCKGAVTLEGVSFDLNKASIRPDGEPVLRQIADALKRCPNIRVRIEAHTDSSGADAYNQQLSERRAESVMKYLVGAGVPASRMESVGFGETRPIATNDTKEGRAQNRRAMIRPIE